MMQPMLGSVMSAKRRTTTDFEARDQRMRRIIGVAMLVPGVGLLGVGAYMLTLSVISLNALICVAVVGGGLTLGGVSQLLGSTED